LRGFLWDQKEKTTKALRTRRTTKEKSLKTMIEVHG
jgi:hypothetical protein